jgi:outer membrane protein OmpA-like peptidoglycan-associated protein
MAAGMLIASIGVTGCATQPYVNERVGAVDSRLGATQGQVDAQRGRLDANDARLADLDRTSREALERAQSAGKLAEGKFLYSMVLSDDSVKFPAGGVKLSAEARTRLTDFANKLKADNRNVYLEIQGHTDATGSDTANRRLGEERAEAVRLFLNQQGVPLNRMATISYGPTAPVASNKTPAGRAQNRRVLIVVLA